MSTDGGLLVTIVLPVYNVENYLDRCVDSVVAQTYGNLEIILVDDGSTDNCPRICDDWSARDSRIKVVHKENAGLGMARNTGIEHASGDYICFFDSDDYIREDAIELIVRCIEETSAELVVFGFTFVNSKGEPERSVVPCTPNRVYEEGDVREWFLPALVGSDQKTAGKYNLWLSAWSTCYSSSLISRTGWRFVSEREVISEDVYSLLGLYARVKSVAILSESLYRYCYNSASLTHVYRADRLDMLARFYRSCIRLCDECGYGNDVRRGIAWTYISFVIGAMKQAAVNGGYAGYEDIKRCLECEEARIALAGIDLGTQPRFRRAFLELARRRAAPLVWLLAYIKGKAY